MHTEPLAIPDVLLLTPVRHGDERGFLSETYSRRRFAAMGIDVEFVQDNHSLSTRPGTVRGLHFQIPPYDQAKLVRVVAGAIWDVAVDLRHGSPSYGCYTAAVLSADNGAQLFVPSGFAHGFCTLEPDTQVVYKVSNPYEPDYDRGLRWCDSALGISWPVAPDEATVSDRDRRLPPFCELPAYFTALPTGG